MMKLVTKNFIGSTDFRRFDPWSTRCLEFRTLKLSSLDAPMFAGFLEF